MIETKDTVIDVRNYCNPLPTGDLPYEEKAGDLSLWKWVTDCMIYEQAINKNCGSLLNAMTVN